MTDVEKLIAEARDVLFSPYLLPEHGLAVAKLISATKVLATKETHTPQHVWDKIADLTAERDEALDVIRSIRLYCENQGDKFRYHAGEILSRISEHPKED